MIKKEIYPKTKRMKLKNTVYVTEKIDGSNLTLFKKNGNLYVAQRKNIFDAFSEIEEAKEIMYKGMYQWLLEHRQYLLDNLLESSCLCVEWLGMGCLKYSSEEFDKKCYMFAKANIDDDLNLYNLKYTQDLFKYPFINQEIPDFIGIVPLVATLDNIPSIEELNVLYDTYTKIVNRNVEGFVINFQEDIHKYVRMKNGKLQDHFERGD